MKNHISMKFTIQKNEDHKSDMKWELACRSMKLDYCIIDLTAHDWHEKVRLDTSDCFLLKLPGETFKYKTVYDERIYVISEVMKSNIYPLLMVFGNIII